MPYSTQHSYIDQSDLVDVLELYFLNSLDDVEEYLPNLYKHPRNLNPSNSLFGQVTTEEMDYCFSFLTEIDKKIMKYIILRDEESLVDITDHYIYQVLPNQNSKQFDGLHNWIWKVYFEAKDSISYTLLKLL
ncbi:hypothetical protein [Picosynechococcus sp. PCC 7117]|uniref:hypothetical protein n=1 Tax=Picosynechococcus sp. PCC 7117 TaxID=195498 RepID=UPI000810E604|nr:hypothetical protein [Picosynechococcus sp. PCC 7117]ANV88483.1 hypothetical protein AWQ22_14005 [Picosynechococcus sp. PCC 7117]